MNFSLIDEIFALKITAFSMVIILTEIVPLILILFIVPTTVVLALPFFVAGVRSCIITPFVVRRSLMMRSRRAIWMEVFTRVGACSQPIGGTHNVDNSQTN